MRLRINQAISVTLLTPQLADGPLVTHTVAAWTLVEGDNNFRASPDSLTGRREACLRRLIGLRLDPTPRI